MHTKGRGFTIVHLLVVLLLGLVALAFLVPTASNVRGGHSRTKCQSNLSQIGKALMLYGNENKGAFPRTLAVADAPASITNDGFDDPNPFLVLPETVLPPGRINNIPGHVAAGADAGPDDRRLHLSQRHSREGHDGGPGGHPAG